MPILSHKEALKELAKHDTGERVSIKQMLDTIVEADFCHHKDGTPMTQEYIFNLSPTGELFHVFEAYEIAKRILAKKGNK